jgi:hypothetical protein
MPHTQISAGRETRYIVTAEVGYMRLEYGGMGTGRLKVAGNAERTETKEPRENFTGPFIMRKRIGATDYEVSAYFSRTSGESLEEKIIRLVRNEALCGGRIQDENS